MATYSYDPSKIAESGKDRMRFELGDTTFAPGELTAALCDEEYLAILSQYSVKWRIAKVKCLEAILMKFAHQVTMSVDGVSYSFSERVKLWKDMLKAEKAKAYVAVPVANPKALIGQEGRPPYFYEDMKSNPRGAGRPRR